MPTSAAIFASISEFNALMKVREEATELKAGMEGQAAPYSASYVGKVRLQWMTANIIVLSWKML